MIVADLKFKNPRPAPPLSAVNLNFGTESTGEAPPVELSLVAVIAAPTALFGMVYDINVHRYTTQEAGMVWERADSMQVSRAGGWQQTATLRQERDQPWEQGAPVRKGVGAAYEDMLRLRKERAVPWEQGLPLLADDVRALYEAMLPRRNELSVPWQEGAARSRSYGGVYEQMIPVRAERVLPWEAAVRLLMNMDLVQGSARYLPVTRDIPWDTGRPPPPGRSGTTQPPVQPPYEPKYNLNFKCPWKWLPWNAVNLNFGLNPCQPGGEVPEKKVYIIVNTLSMKRVDDNTPIELVSAEVGIDKDSWTWSFSGSVPYYEFEKIEPEASGPVEVELEINGLIWRLLIENYNTKELFAKTDISIKGRSVTALLSDPYAPVRSYVQSTTMMSRQIAEAELTRPGLVTGFTLDWQLIDSLGWQMPANTWSYTDLTPIQVMQALAEGAGGYVNSHPSARTVIVKQDYPLPFWEWDSATPAATIPRSLIKAQSLDWLEKPAYNGVRVTGEHTGVSAFVRRDGTGGLFPAPMFVSPMISANAAARNKGISILSSGGKQATVGLDLPMDPSLGLYTPGMLLQVQKNSSGSWRGLVRSTHISAAWGEGLTVNQAVGLERHYGGL